MSWAVRAVQLPDGDWPVDLWVDTAGCLVTEPVPGAERLPGRYVVPGLVDSHAHPAVGREAGMPVALDGSEALNVLAGWAACGVCLVRDTGSAGGSALHLDLVPGMPRLQAAGRFLAPAGRYFPVLLPEAAPQEQLTELAVGELARGGRWVKVIADFPPVTDGMPSGPPELTYSGEAIKAGAAWTPTLCAVVGLPDTASEAARRRVAEYRQRLPELLPLAQRLGVPVLAGTDTAGTIACEVALLAAHGLEPAAALKAATTTGYRFLGEPFNQAGQPATLVTYQDDPREDLAILSSPRAIIIDGVRVR